MIPYLYNDGGKSKAKLRRYRRAKSDCSIVSAAISFNADFGLIWGIYESNGRKSGQGATMELEDKVLRLIGKEYNKKIRRFVILKFLIDFIQDYKVGTYIIFSSKFKYYHFSTVINGVLHDNQDCIEDDRIVHIAFKIT